MTALLIYDLKEIIDSKKTAKIVHNNDVSPVQTEYNNNSSLLEEENERINAKIVDDDYENIYSSSVWAITIILFK